MCLVWWWRRQWHPTPVLSPGNSHGQRSQVGCSPWGHEESDMTEGLHFHFSLSCIGEGNGNPLQRSCLEHPRDGGAWWAAVYGVAQSRTWLKRLSSSSSSSSSMVMFSAAALFTIAKSWKQLKCPLVDKYINKMWYIHTIEIIFFKKWSSDPCYRMDRLWRYYAK